MGNNTPRRSHQNKPSDPSHAGGGLHLSATGVRHSCPQVLGKGGTNRRPHTQEENGTRNKNITSLLVVDVRTPEAESLSRLGWYKSLAMMCSGLVTYSGKANVRVPSVQASGVGNDVTRIEGSTRPRCCCGEQNRMF